MTTQNICVVSVSFTGSPSGPVPVYDQAPRTSQITCLEDPRHFEIECAFHGNENGQRFTNTPRAVSKCAMLTAKAASGSYSVMRLSRLRFIPSTIDRRTSSGVPVGITISTFSVFEVNDVAEPKRFVQPRRGVFARAWLPDIRTPGRKS